MTTTTLAELYTGEDSDRYGPHHSDTVTGTVPLLIVHHDEGHWISYLGPNPFSDIDADQLAQYLPQGSSEAAACNDCQRPIYWDENRKDYRHAKDPQQGCFLISGETT